MAKTRADSAEMLKAGTEKGRATETHTQGLGRNCDTVESILVINNLIK